MLNSGHSRQQAQVESLDSCNPLWGMSLTSRNTVFQTSGRNCNCTPVLTQSIGLSVQSVHDIAVQVDESSKQMSSIDRHDYDTSDPWGFRASLQPFDGEYQVDSMFGESSKSRGGTFRDTLPGSD